MGEAPLEIRRFAALEPGPRLIVLGAVHGNEPCGPLAIGRIVDAIRSGAISIRRGSVTVVPVANPMAFRLKTREGDRNLNRDLRARAEPQDNEDRLGTLLCPLLAEHDVLLDLHSFTGDGPPFVFAGPDDNAGAIEPFALAGPEWALARRLGVAVAMHGWLDAHEQFRAERARLGFPPLPATEGVGTTEFMRAAGGYAVTLECGRHDDPDAVGIAERAVRAALAHLGLVDEDPPPSTTRTAIRLSDSLVCEREGDRIADGWRTGDPVPDGAVLGHRADGAPIRQDGPGFIVFPNPRAKPGQMLAFLGRTSDRPLS